jgi:hypothetical protein
MTFQDYFWGSASNVGAVRLELAARHLYLAATSPPKEQDIQPLVINVETSFADCLNSNFSSDRCDCLRDRTIRKQLDYDHLQVHQCCEEWKDGNKFEELSSGDVQNDFIMGKLISGFTTSCCLPCDSQSTRITDEDTWADAVSDEQMASTFKRLRKAFEILCTCNDQGDIDLVREQAAAVRQMAAHSGLQRMAGQAARMLAAEQYVTRDMLDDAQRELDATEALWRAVGWVM